MSEKTCFVIIGFGRKMDYSTGRMIDLDKTFEYIIKPVFEDLKFIKENMKTIEKFICIGGIESAFDIVKAIQSLFIRLRQTGIDRPKWMVKAIFSQFENN